MEKALVPNTTNLFMSVHNLKMLREFFKNPSGHYVYFMSFTLSFWE